MFCTWPRIYLYQINCPKNSGENPHGLQKKAKKVKIKENYSSWNPKNLYQTSNKIYILVTTAEVLIMDNDAFMINNFA